MLPEQIANREKLRFAMGTGMDDVMDRIVTELIDPEEIKARPKAAYGLPFATFNLRQPAMPARVFMNADVPVAVATDFNPGSAPSYHLPAAMTPRRSLIWAISSKGFSFTKIKSALLPSSMVPKSSTPIMALTTFEAFIVPVAMAS